MSGIAALLTAVGAFATDPVLTVSPSDPFPVGNEAFFRKEGAKLVRNANWGFGCTDPDGTEYNLVHMLARRLGNLNEDGSWSEERILARTKQLVTEYFVHAWYKEFFAKHTNGTYGLGVWWNNPIGEAFSYDSGIFRLVQGPDGKWAPPASVLDEIAFKFGNSVFARFSGLQYARLRWWDGKEFNDSNPYSSISLASVRKTSAGFDGGPYTVFVDPVNGVLALPAKPILEKSLGILTMTFADGTIVRYFTQTGTQLPGIQKEREPLLVGIRQVWFGARILPSGDFESLASLVFERSQDLQKWSEILDDGVDGGIANGGMGVVPQGIEFYRARYR